MMTHTLTADRTQAWETDEAFRRDLRASLSTSAEAKGERHVEVYSHDGVTLDAWDLDVAEVAS